MAITGRYYDAQRSQAIAATLTVVGNDSLVVQVGDVRRTELLESVSVSERIGAIPRRFTFADGAVFETADNDAVDVLFPRSDERFRWVHALERRWRTVVTSLVLVILASVLFVRSGIPWLAHRVADALPPAVDAAIGAHTLEILDRSVLAGSTLPPDRQQALQAMFRRVADEAGTGNPLRLALRDSKALGANAIALPAGTLVLTDALVRLSRDDEELLAVIAHEMGHVRQRHALRELLQGAGVSAMAVVLFGDLTSLSVLTGAVPWLLQAKHSRDFEREADAFSRDWLARHGIAPHRFDDILCRLSAQRDNKDVVVPNYLSTHPATKERAACGR